MWLAVVQHKMAGLEQTNAQLVQETACLEDTNTQLLQRVSTGQQQLLSLPPTGAFCLSAACFVLTDTLCSLTYILDVYLTPPSVSPTYSVFYDNLSLFDTSLK